MATEVLPISSLISLPSPLLDARGEVAADPRVGHWWLCMIGLGLANILFLGISHRNFPPRDVHERRVQLLTTLYVVGAAWRSGFPILWESRPHGCLFATPGMFAGGELIDQLVSHIAESSIAMLITMRTERALRALGCPRCAKLAGLCCWMIICIARTACWYGTTTDNKLAHVIEESTWALFGCALAVLSLIGLTTAAPKEADVAQSFGFLCTVLPVLVAYVAFMVHTDVPMYYNEWIEDSAKSVVYLSVFDGLQEMVRCDAVVQALKPWKEAILWQTGYFAVIPFLTVLVMRVRLPLQDADKAKTS